MVRNQVSRTSKESQSIDADFDDDHETTVRISKTKTSNKVQKLRINEMETSRKSLQVTKNNIQPYQ